MDLGSNSIGYDGTSMLAEGLMLSDLQHLFVSRNNIGDSGAHALAGILFYFSLYGKGALFNSRKLLTLDISENKIGVNGAKHIADALKENSSLTYLSMDRNEIGSTGAASLAETLRENQTLKTLILSSNKIESKSRSIDIAGTFHF